MQDQNEDYPGQSFSSVIIEEAPVLDESDLKILGVDYSSDVSSEEKEIFDRINASPLHKLLGIDNDYSSYDKFVPFR